MAALLLYVYSKDTMVRAVKILKIPCVRPCCTNALMGLSYNILKWEDLP